MAKRKGQAKGKGRGYKNLPNFPKDPKVHSDSARGRKQPQPIRFIRGLPLKSNRLPIQFGIIVPSTEKDRKISDEEFQRRIDNEKKFFSKNFGGDTSIRTVGSYWDGKKLIQEKGALITSSMSMIEYNKRRKKLANHITAIQKRWKQDTILYNIEGQDFIMPKKSYLDDDKGQSDLILIS